MHYKNGREAKSGDRVVMVPQNGPVVSGVIHSLQPGATTCNGRVAPTSQSDAYVTVGECMHADDILHAMNTSKPPVPELECLPAPVEEACEAT